MILSMDSNKDKIGLEPQERLPGQINFQGRFTASFQSIYKIGSVYAVVQKGSIPTREGLIRGTDAVMGPRHPI